jgi:adhesin transport system membrane fusion protein
MAAIEQWELDGRAVGRRGDGARGFACLLLFVIAAFVAGFVVWARGATLIEVTRGAGTVVLSGKAQRIQSPVGGVLVALDARKGAIVEKGHALARIEDATDATAANQSRAAYLKLLATTVRLRAEADGDDAANFPEEIIEDMSTAAESERNRFDERRAALDRDVQVSRDRAERKREEIAELKAKAAQSGRARDLAEKELAVLKPLVARGVSPKLETLRVERNIQALRTQLENATLAIQRAQTALREAERDESEKVRAFRATARRELNERQAALEALRRPPIAVGVARTEIRAPMRGKITRIFVARVGAAIRSGQVLFEIAPLKDTLLVEVEINASDRAYLHLGQKATVRFSARKPSIYRVAEIGADAVTDAAGTPRYRVRLRADADNPASGPPVAPGMRATVEIETGRKTVLDHLLKPVIQMRDTALRER